MRIAFALSVALLLASSSAVRAQTVIDTCGQVVETGILAADLDCSASAAGYAVKVTRGKLNLGGFTLTAPSSHVAVHCGEFPATACRVTGPGTVIGGIAQGASQVFKMSNFTIDAAGYSGPLGYGDKMRLDRVTATGFTTIIPGGIRIRITDSQLVGSPMSTVGVYSGRVTVARSSITGFGTVGVNAEFTLRLVDSSVTGNELDIASGSLPRLKGTSTCGTSYNYSTLAPWGVCTDD
jgi:hypothetical protein